MILFKWNSKKTKLIFGDRKQNSGCLCECGVLARKENEGIFWSDECVLLLDLGFVIRIYGLPRWLSAKNLSANAGDKGLIPGLGRSPGVGNGNPPKIITGKIPWTEEPGRLQSMGLQSRTQLSTHAAPRKFSESFELYSYDVFIVLLMSYVNRYLVIQLKYGTCS